MSTLLACRRRSINVEWGAISVEYDDLAADSGAYCTEMADFGTYSALVAQLIRRLLRQSKFILTVIAPIRTESIHRYSVNRHKLKLYHPPDTPTTFVSDCCLCNMVKVWYVGDVNPGADRFAFVIGSV